jgi:hypothetical protein
MRLRRKLEGQSAEPLTERRGDKISHHSVTVG